MEELIKYRTVDCNGGIRIQLVTYEQLHAYLLCQKSWLEDGEKGR